MERDIEKLKLGGLNAAGVVSSGLTRQESGELPIISVLKVMCSFASDELQDRRGADVIVVDTPEYIGFEKSVKEVCKPGTVVLDPFKCSLEMCLSLVRMGAKTSKAGLYAPL